MKKFVGVNLFFIVILSFTIHAMTVFGLDGADVNGQYGKMVTGIRVPEKICSIAKGELQKKREKPEGNKGSPQNRWGIQLDEIEQDMIARITMLEAGAEPDRGQQAVVEVILNRMYSDQFPDTVYECRLPRYLTKPRQRRSEWDMAGSDGISRVSAVFRGELLLTNKMRII